MRRVAVIVVTIGLAASTTTQAQTREFMLRGFADIGSRTFTAKHSFAAILGDDRGIVFGGGVDAVLPQRIFITLRASRFRDTGQRVFIFNGERFDLGIPTTITIAPVTLGGGYRADFGWRIVPYGGAGVGWHRYTETSTFAEDSENLDERFQGYSVLGGAEIRIARWLGTAFEAEWTTVPDAFSQDPNANSSVARQFKESDLGGVTMRVKVVVGR